MPKRQFDGNGAAHRMPKERAPRGLCDATHQFLPGGLPVFDDGVLRRKKSTAVTEAPVVQRQDREAGRMDCFDLGSVLEDVAKGAVQVQHRRRRRVRLRHPDGTHALCRQRGIAILRRARAHGQPQEFIRRRDGLPVLQRSWCGAIDQRALLGVDPRAATQLAHSQRDRKHRHTAKTR